MCAVAGHLKSATKYLGTSWREQFRLKLWMCMCARRRTQSRTWMCLCTYIDIHILVYIWIYKSIFKYIKKILRCSCMLCPSNYGWRQVFGDTAASLGARDRSHEEKDEEIGIQPPDLEWGWLLIPVFDSWALRAATFTPGSSSTASEWCRLALDMNLIFWARKRSTCRFVFGGQHQAVTWSLKSPLYNDTIHLTGVYIFPDENQLQEFFDTLIAHSNQPPHEPHIYAGDDDDCFYYCKK